MNILDALIRLIIYLGIFGSLTYLFRNTAKSTVSFFRHKIQGVAQRRHLRKDQISGVDPIIAALSKRRLLSSHINDLLEATVLRDVSKESTFTRFIYGSLILGGCFYLLAFFATDHFFTGIPFAILGTILPYIFLRIYKVRLGIQNSYDIAIPISVLSQKYAKHNHKMIIALHETLSDLPDTPIKRAFARLTMRLERFTTEQDAIEAIESFNIQVGTNWGPRLSSLILAGVQGLDVNTSLKELETQFTAVRNRLKDENANRTDTLLIGIAPIVLFPVTLAGTYLFVTRSAFTLLLTNPNGRMVLLFSLVFVILAPIIAITFYRPKQDL